MGTTYEGPTRAEFEAALKINNHSGDVQLYHLNWLTVAGWFYIDGMPFQLKAETANSAEKLSFGDCEIIGIAKDGFLHFAVCWKWMVLSVWYVDIVGKRLTSIDWGYQINAKTAVSFVQRV